MRAIVLAAGRGSRLHPLTERWPKPVLPIDGRPAIGSLLRELAAAGCDDATLVTGHLAEQVEALVGDGGAYGLSVHYARQPAPLGTADAVLRANLQAPYLVCAADTLFQRGAVAGFLGAVPEACGGAVAVRRQPGRPEHTRIRVEGGKVARVVDPGAAGGLTAAPLLLVGVPVAERVEAATRAPYQRPFQIADAFQLAIDAEFCIAAVEIGRTRDLTDPLDLIRENFPYLGRNE